MGYVEQFYKLVLDPLNPEIIYNHLISTYGEDVSIICYEKPQDFCHRHIVADWFHTHLGVIINEHSN